MMEAGMNTNVMLKDVNGVVVSIVDVIIDYKLNM